LKGTPLDSLPMPPGIATVLIDRASGLPTTPDDPDSMNEYFKVEDVDRLRSQATQQQQEQQNPYNIF
jgi:penicillin-binding protein 1A